MSRRSEGRAGTAIKSLAGKAYVPVDKIKLRQEERKAKNRYQAIKQQEEKQKRKKTTHTDDDSQTNTASAVTLETFHDPNFDALASKGKKRKRGQEGGQPPPAKKSRTESSEYPVESKEPKEQPPAKKSRYEPKRADPYFKAKNQFHKEQERRAAAKKEKEERLRAIHERAEQRRKKGRKLTQHNSKGQPIMKNLMASLIPKIEQVTQKK